MYMQIAYYYKHVSIDTVIKLDFSENRIICYYLCIVYTEPIHRT